MLEGTLRSTPVLPSASLRVAMSEVSIVLALAAAALAVATVVVAVDVVLALKA